MDIMIRIPNETMAIWLSDLFLEASKDARGAMENENLFALGSFGDDAIQHSANAEECEEYAEMLLEVYNEIQKYWK